MQFINEKCGGLWTLLLRVLSLNAGGWTLMAGILGFGSDETAFEDIVVYMYLIVFGALILLLEIKWIMAIMTQAIFYNSIVGRSLFYFFLGCLPLNRSNALTVFGAFVLISAFIFMIIGLLGFIPGTRETVPHGIPPPLCGYPNSMTAETKTAVQLDTTNQAEEIRPPPVNPPAAAQGPPPAPGASNVYDSNDNGFDTYKQSSNDNAYNA